jgi:alkylation response protein AidB-like acyl-CoA dehydrogenase
VYEGTGLVAPFLALFCGTVGEMAQPSPHPIFTPEHDELRASVRRFVDTELRPHVDDWEDAGLFPDEVFRRAGELGFLGLHYPERWGGAGGDLAAEVVFIEELSKAGCGAIAMALGVQTDMATPALAEFGSDEQREHYLRPAIAGTKIAAIGITEPDAGSDVAGISTNGVRDGDVWRISGAKLYITNGARADFMTCVVQTDRGSSHRGISLFLVDMDLHGVRVSRKLRKLGMLSSDTAEIALDDVVVPHANLIGGEPGQGFAQLMWQLQYERISGAAACLGYAEWILDETIAYAKQRKTFGVPIAGHQVIAHKLADAATDLAAARALTYDTVWRLQHGDYPVAEISMAKKHSAQMFNRVADTCLQVHGGAGYMHEYPVSRAFRDARLQRIGAGTDEIMNEVIAKRLGITP